MAGCPLPGYKGPDTPTKVPLAPAKIYLDRISETAGEGFEEVSHCLPTNEHEPEKSTVSYFPMKEA